jgi:NitT/TauT family transport system substrate-binding protein
MKIPGLQLTRRWTGAVVLLAALLAPSATPAQPALTKVRLASLADDNFTSVIYAQSTGMFRRAGIDLEITPMTSGGAIYAAVLGGSIDIGKASLVSVFSAHERGVPFTLIAPAGMYDARSPYAQLLVLKTSAIHSGADLNGKVVSSVSLKSLDQISVQAWVDQHGGDSSTLKFLELPQSGGAAALDAHRIDAALLFYPQLAAAMATGNFRVLAPAYSAVAPRFLISAYVTTADWATKNADTVRAFNAVVVKAAAFANAHHAETVSSVAQFTGIPAAVIAGSPRAVLAESLDPALIQPQIDIAVKYGALTRPFAARDILFEEPRR